MRSGPTLRSTLALLLHPPLTTYHLPATTYLSKQQMFSLGPRLLGKGQHHLLPLEL